MPQRPLLAAVITAALVAAVGGANRAAQGPAGRCSISGKGAFDIGWTEKTPTGSFRCMPTFDSDLKASGAAWIRVEANGTVGAVLPR